MSGKHVSRFVISPPTNQGFIVMCPGDRLGLCGGHRFETYQEARQWVRQEEEGK